MYKHPTQLSGVSYGRQRKHRISSCQMGKAGNEVGVATAWLPGVTA